MRSMLAAVILLLTLAVVEVLADNRLGDDGTNIQTLVHYNGPYCFEPYALSAHDGNLYWTDTCQSRIQSVSLRVRGASPFSDPVQTILDEREWTQIDSPRGVAFHAGWMYWTDSGRIHRSKLDGTVIEVVGSMRDSYVLTIHDDKIYWTAWSFWSDDGAVERSSLDGTNPERLHYRRTARYSAIEIHGSKIYWADVLGAIMRSNLDGSEVEIVVTQGDLSTFRPYGVAVHDGKIYWTGWPSLTDPSDTGRIHRANLDGSQIETLVTGLDQPMASSSLLTDTPHPEDLTISRNDPPWYGWEWWECASDSASSGRPRQPLRCVRMERDDRRESIAAGSV